MNTAKWVAVWGSSPSYTAAVPAVYAKNITLRYHLRAPFGGSRVRLHFNNLYGGEGAVIPRVYLAKSGRSAVPVTFGGEFACRLPFGAQVVSDEIDFSLARGEEYAVSFYLADFTPLRCGTKDTGPLCRFEYAEGDYAAAEALPAQHTVPIETAYFIDTVDLLTEEAHASAVVCFGDSITAQSWPDYLALRLLRDGNAARSVVRRGIGGSRVLRSYQHLQHRHYGAAGRERFEREVSAAGADRVIILHGINDIIHPNGSAFRPWSDLPTAEELIAGLRWYVEKGHQMGLRVYLTTIPTIKGWQSFVPLRDDIRHAVNAWIHSQTEADGVVDFDAATRCADDPDMRISAYDSGDHLHPSLQGAEHMAESVPVKYLRDF